MKAAILTVILTVITILSGCATLFAQERSIMNEPDTQTTNKKQPVLVELFTSEGCNTCPPADRVLAKLQKDQPIPTADVITLGFHVTYWDSSAWKDRFSSIEYTRRQQMYAQIFRLDKVYTPQMVVDGSAELVGSEREKAKDVITKSAARPKGAIDLKIDNGKLQINISKLTTHGEAVVFVAVAESKLTTNVGGGENSGNKLEHSSVVRDLIPISLVKATDNSLNLEWAMSVNKDWKAGNLKYVVFVQEKNTLRILAVNQTDH